MRRTAFPVPLLGLAAAATVAAADIRPFPSTRPLVPAQLERGDAGIGAAWAGVAGGGNNHFALSGHYGALASLDLALSLIPTGGPSLLAQGDLQYTPWQSGPWSAGLGLGGFFPVGTMETYHFDHGEVRHAVSGVRLGLDVRWRGLYAGTGYLHAWDRRDYDPATAPADSRAREFAGAHSVYSLGGSQQHLGIVLGDALQFRAEVLMLDEALQNLLFEPSDPTRADGLSLTAGIAYTPGRRDGKPRAPAARPPAPTVPPTAWAPPDSVPREGLFDMAQYRRGVLWGAAASLAGALAGAAAGTTVEDEHAFLPPELMLAVAGAVVTIPIGAAGGVLTHPRDPRAAGKARPVAWTLAGTGAGFLVGGLLAPVTGGLSFYFLTPLGSAMGYRHGTR